MKDHVLSTIHSLDVSMILDYANTNELITICKVASKFKGKYISHMRNEGRNVLEALDEFITISKEANIPAC